MSTIKPDGDRDTANEEASFEDLTAQLEEVVAQLEKGDQSLDEALACYERGIELVRRCNDLLDRAELRVSQISTAITERAAAEPREPVRPRSLFGFDDDDGFSDDE